MVQPSSKIKWLKKF